MRVAVPDQPAGRLSDAWRFRVGTGRFDLPPRRDHHERRLPGGPAGDAGTETPG